MTACYPQKLPLTLSTNNGRSVDIVCLRTKTTEFVVLFFVWCDKGLQFFYLIIISHVIREVLRSRNLGGMSHLRFKRRPTKKPPVIIEGNNAIGLHCPCQRQAVGRWLIPRRPGSDHVGFVVYKAALDQVSSQCFVSSSSHSPRLLHTHHNSSFWAGTVDQMVPRVPNGLSLTSPKETERLKISTWQRAKKERE
jgi:hypothetical protein